MSFEGVEEETLEGMHKNVVASVSNGIADKPFGGNPTTLLQMGWQFWLRPVLIGHNKLHHIYQKRVDHRRL